MLIHVHIYTHRARFLPSLSHCNITMIESVLKSCENSTISLSSEMSKDQASLKGYSHLYYGKNLGVFSCLWKSYIKHVRRYGWLLTGEGLMMVNFDCQLEWIKGCLELCVCASVTKIIWSRSVCICWKWTLRSRKALYPNSSMYISSFLQNSLSWGRLSTQLYNTEKREQQTARGVK